MYNQRRQRLQSQTLQPEDVEMEMAPPSIGTPSISLQHETASVNATTQRTTNFVVLQEAEMDSKTRRKIPKNITFEPLSDLALKHFRELLTRDYRTTINDIIRNTGGVNEAVLTSILQPVVVNIDRKLRQLTFPGTIDPNLFNIQLDRILEELKVEVDDKYMDIAQTIGLKVRNSEAELVREQDELDEWIEKNRNAREALQSKPATFTAHDDPDDYVQSLIKYPSHIAFDL
ncbi:hypothetical protein G6F46_009031 [Rhizopus delemar]|uniref:Uncharacterized protein n=2 Tax=Rhizopus TaxID=4842 RepID=A0A9P6Z6A0_9FUNG|nr:hypothetical protein G6F55_007999 [Rhizopus delemar]KAG1545466.1 hypothetical protein G6F51_005453 [Rhizopus arrhizus]KAG1493314.1 hypothetical protein G6F54_008667 [Rhizopus delemar]KAG1507413.1 hypothetical protein G6F53_008968 [Rhizopus delemar]KAG1517172.1 hypothetical protein G6F52_009289 [Rhizopus delemar]